MKKETIMKVLLGMAFCFLWFVGGKEITHADCIWFPEDQFQQEHSCEKQWDLNEGRYYEVTAESVGVYQSPDSEEPHKAVEKGETLRIYYIYKDEETNKDWGCYFEGCWVPLEGLKLVYDATEFRKDHESEIQGYNNELEDYEVVLPVTIYHYPGAEETTNEIGDYHTADPQFYPEDTLTPEEIYIDEEGKVWGYLRTYHWGYIRGWYCISDLPKRPDSYVAGDMNLDGNVSLDDARKVLRVALLLDKTTDFRRTVGDLNGDGECKLNDAAIALRTAVLLTEERIIVRNN